MILFKYKYKIKNKFFVIKTRFYPYADKQNVTITVQAMVYKSFKLQQQYDAGITIADDVYCNDNKYVFLQNFFLHASDNIGITFYHRVRPYFKSFTYLQSQMVGKVQ